MSTEWPRLLAIGAFTLACWVAALSALAYRSRPSDEVVAWAPPGQLAQLIAASPVSVVDAGGTGFAVLRGDAPGFVARLYAGGAWLVLPARKGGCAAGSALPGSWRSAPTPSV